MRVPVAIAHDYLTQSGGAERLLLEIASVFPDAPIYTTLYEPDTTFPGYRSKDIRTSVLNRFGFLRRSHRLAFPLLAPAVSSIRVDADVVLCSSAGWAHGVRASGMKLVYCNTPAKWIYDLDRYAGTKRSLTYLGGRALRPFLAAWDRKAAATADRYLANSSAVRDRIKDAYGIDAEVLFPPMMVDVGGPDERILGIEPGFFLVASRLLPYKNVAAVVEAFRGLDHRLLVVGGGPGLEELRMAAPSNVFLAGEVSEVQLRWAFRHAVGIVTAAWEDFGLVPVEGAAYGLPTAALGWGGHLDTVRPGETGVFFDHPTSDRIRAAVEVLAGTDWDPDLLRAHSDRFSSARFRERLVRIVDEMLER